MSDKEIIYIDPSDLPAGTPPPPPGSLPATKQAEYINAGAKIIVAIGFLVILVKTSGTADIPNFVLYLVLALLLTASAAKHRVKEKSGQGSIIALIIMFTAMIIINSIWPGASFKSAYKSLFMTEMVYLDKDVKNQSVDIPDKTTVRFKSNKRFSILERRGTNSDGSYILEPIKMPPGKSERYFAWGGNISLLGLYDGTVLEISY